MRPFFGCSSIDFLLWEIYLLNVSHNPLGRFLIMQLELEKS